MRLASFDSSVRAVSGFLLGHVSTQTTGRYLGCKQKLRDAVNDRMGIESDVAS